MNICARSAAQSSAASHGDYFLLISQPGRLTMSSGRAVECHLRNSHATAVVNGYAHIINEPYADRFSTQTYTVN